MANIHTSGLTNITTLNARIAPETRHLRLEDASGCEGWIKSHWRNLPAGVAGVYAIYLKAELMYIGISVNFRTRFILHQIGSGRIAYKNFIGDPNDVVAFYLPCSDRPFCESIERALIFRLQPKLNDKFKGVRS